MNQSRMVLHRLSVWARCTRLLKQASSNLQQVLRNKCSTQGCTKPVSISTIWPCVNSYQISRSHSEASVRTFFTSAVYSFSKKFDTKKLQLFNVYDNNGEFIQTSELYNVEKFCMYYKNFNMRTLHEPLSSDADSNLPSVQISFNKLRSKRMKQITLNVLDDWAMEKVKKTLLEDGGLMIEISGKKMKEIKEKFDSSWIPTECEVTTIKQSKQEILLKVNLSVKVSSPILKLLYEEICSKNEEFLNQLKELEELKKEQGMNKE